MLVLTVPYETSVFIGSNIVVHAIEARGHGPRLGFTAPRDIPIHREGAKVIVPDPESLACDKERVYVEMTPGHAKRLMRLLKEHSEFMVVSAAIHSALTVHN